MEAVYAFEGNFVDGLLVAPEIKIDGKVADTTMYAGRSDSLNEWQDYVGLLSDGSYLQDALAEYPELNQKVVVYRISNLMFDDMGLEEIYPTLAATFTMNPEKTIVLTWGSTGGSYGPDKGEYCKSFHVPDEHEPGYGEDVYLIVLGDDIENLTLQGYEDGGCDEGEEFSGISADLEKYESTLGEMVWELVIENEVAYESEIDGEFVSDEMLYGSVAELMYDYGILSANVTERYGDGVLEDMEIETYHMQRVMYMKFDVVVPANSTITVEATMDKRASIDYTGSGVDRKGYDMMTTLASNLEFSRQTASISNTEYIDILAQNFGFDLENGITSVELDLNEPHYWLEVLKKEDLEEK